MFTRLKRWGIVVASLTALFQVPPTAQAAESYVCAISFVGDATITRMTVTEIGLWSDSLGAYSGQFMLLQNDNQGWVAIKLNGPSMPGMADAALGVWMLTIDKRRGRASATGAFNDANVGPFTGNCRREDVP